MKPCETVANRMLYEATLTKRYDGMRIGFNNHALRRSIGRYYEFMSNELLMDNIHELLAQIPDLDYYLMDIPLEGSFVVTRERDGLTIFASYTLSDEESCGEGLREILVYIHTVLVADERQRVWVDDNDKLLLKVCKDGTIQENPWELRRGKQKRNA